METIKEATEQVWLFFKNDTKKWLPLENFGNFKDQQEQQIIEMLNGNNDIIKISVKTEYTTTYVLGDKNE